ncbi:5509_t:CDS:2 [Entrophospora sp. SA101]|nr:5509_t:CDS:2 [Entrophospora sp. SA101]
MLIKILNSFVVDILIFTIGFTSICLTCLRLLKELIITRKNIWKIKDRNDLQSKLYSNDPNYGKHKTLKIEENFFHYVEAGNVEGPLILFLHGFPEFWYSWRFQLEGLKDTGYYLVAVDMRGYGGSYKPIERSAYDSKFLLDDIHSFIQKLSKNGRAACVVAAAQSWEWDQYSDKSGYIDRLIILNGPNTLVWQNNAKERFKQVFHYNNLKTLINQPRQTLRNSWAILTPCIRQFCMSNYIFRFKIPYLPERLFVLKDVSAYDEFFKSMNNVSAEDIEMFKAAACMENYASIKGGMNYYRSNAMLGFYNEQEKRGIKQVGFIGIPTLVIWGEKDEFLESDLCLDNLSKHVSNLETIRIPDAGHFIHEQIPEQINDLIRRFINSNGNLHDLNTTK